MAEWMLYAGPAQARQLNPVGSLFALPLLFPNAKQAWLMATSDMPEGQTIHPFRYVYTYFNFVVAVHVGWGAM